MTDSASVSLIYVQADCTLTKIDLERIKTMYANNEFVYELRAGPGKRTWNATVRRRKNTGTDVCIVSFVLYIFNFGNLLLFIVLMILFRKIFESMVQHIIGRRNEAHASSVGECHLHMMKNDSFAHIIG